jgi:hypothetical protein
VRLSDPGGIDTDHWRIILYTGLLPNMASHFQKATSIIFGILLGTNPYMLNVPNMNLLHAIHHPDMPSI